MNKKEIERRIKILQGFLDGKQIQQDFGHGYGYEDVDNPRFTETSFNYRLKPPPYTRRLLKK